VKRLEDGIIYALKRVKLKDLKEKEVQNAVNEVRILASIKHINVISYKEAFMEPKTKSLCIVMEFADGGDLY
jgi:NIMA (never in mitosis gene a)-related kinase